MIINKVRIHGQTSYKYHETPLVICDKILEGILQYALSFFRNHESKLSKVLKINSHLNNMVKNNRIYPCLFTVIACHIHYVRLIKFHQPIRYTSLSKLMAAIAISDVQNTNESGISETCFCITMHCYSDQRRD